MRKRIYSKVLKKRLNIAWDCLPKNKQYELRNFIRYIDETPRLEGTFIYARPGLQENEGVEIIEGPLAEGTGYTFFFSSGTREFCDVILPADPLALFSGGAALAIILHELSHSYEYCLHRRKASEADRYEAEVYAWTQAIEWAEEGLSETDSIDNLRHYAKLAILHETQKADQQSVE